MSAAVLVMRHVHLRNNDLRFEMVGDEVLIGRDPTCDIAIANKCVSRRHVRVRLFDGALHVTALAHGVRVRGMEMEVDVEEPFPLTPLTLVGEWYLWIEGRPEPNV